MLKKIIKFSKKYLKTYTHANAHIHCHLVIKTTENNTPSTEKENLQGLNSLD